MCWRIVYVLHSGHNLNRNPPGCKKSILDIDFHQREIMDCMCFCGLFQTQLCWILLFTLKGKYVNVCVDVHETSIFPHISLQANTKIQNRLQNWNQLKKLELEKLFSNLMEQLDDKKFSVIDWNLLIAWNGNQGNFSQCNYPLREIAMGLWHAVLIIVYIWYNSRYSGWFILFLVQMEWYRWDNRCLQCSGMC